MVTTNIHSIAKMTINKNNDNPRNLSLLTDLLAASSQQNNNINNTNVQSNNLLQGVSQAENLLNTIKQLNQINSINQINQVQDNIQPQNNGNGNIASLLQKILQNQQNNTQQQQVIEKVKKVQKKHKQIVKKVIKNIQAKIPKQTQQSQEQKQKFEETLQQYQYVCLDKKNFCEVSCKDKCNIESYSKMFAEKNRQIIKNGHKFSQKTIIHHEQIDCKQCKEDCYNAIANVCVQNEQKFKPISKEAFYTFKLNSKNCQDKGYVCTKICQLDYCQNNFSPECSQCKLDCNEGSLSGCYLSQNKYQYIDFQRVFNDFKRGKSKLKCETCDSEIKYYCKNECGSKKLKCIRECTKKALFSCQSQCLGDKQTFYQKQLINKIRNFLRRMKGSCSNCQQICKNEVTVVCNTIDETCQNQYKTMCTNNCLQKYCGRFLTTKRNTKARKLYLRIAFQKFQIIMNRVKAYQKLRRAYDDKLEEDMRREALKDNRKRIIMLLKGSEQNFYQSKETQYEQEQEKSQQYEEAFMLKMESILKSPEAYKQIEGTVYDIFSE